MASGLGPYAAKSRETHSAIPRLSPSWFDPCGPGLILQVGVEDRHGEVERPVPVLVVEEQDSDELLAHVNFRRIGFLRASDDTDRVVRKGLAQEALDFCHL